MKLKRKLRKQKEKQELVSKALDYKEFSTQKNEKTKVFSMMALSNLCKHYRNYFNITGYYGRKSCKWRYKNTCAD